VVLVTYSQLGVLELLIHLFSYPPKNHGKPPSNSNSS
jgi:hypothetical protein